MRLPRPTALLLSLLPVVLLGCPSDEEYEEVTYYQDIAPLLAEHCEICHTPGGTNPDVLFDDAESARSMSSLIAAVVVSGVMPPFFAEETEECPNPWGFTNDPTLDPSEKDLIAAWASDGGPIGDPANPAPIPPPPSLDLADADVSVFPAGRYTAPPAGDTDDEFICFSIDPALTEQKWLDAFQVLPEDLEVVHHVLVGVDQAGASAALVDENGVLPCFGSFGVEAEFVGGWIPNASPIVFPERSAVRISAGSRVVLQIHYHLAPEEHQDGTGIALRWAEGTPVREAAIGLVGNAAAQAADGTGLQPGPNDTGDPAFFIPAGVAEHTETMDFNAWAVTPREMQVFLVANHMHYVGNDMRMWIERGDGAPADEPAEACLLHTPTWDFDWQQFYHYDAAADLAPRIYEGDHLWLRCEYDNTLDNPGVRRALLEAGLEEPVDVELGEGSLNEMCIGILGTVYEVPMTIVGETHQGDLAVLSSSAGFGFEDIPCMGPASTSIGIDGSVRGIAACGLDVLGVLATVEISFEGTVDADGVASGQLTVGALGVDGGGTSPWTGTLSGDVLLVEVDTDDAFGTNNVSFAGTITAALMP